MSGLRSAIDDHLGVDVADLLGDELESVASETAQAIDRLSAYLAQVVDEARRRQVPEAAGFGSPVSWLAALADWGHGDAKRHVSLGRTLHAHPRTASKATDGSLSSSRLRVLSRAAGRHPDNYRSDEDMLLGFARDLELKDLRRAAQHWANVVDAVQAEEEAFEQSESSYLHASSTLDGRVKIDGLLDKERGEAVLTALDAAMAPEARAGGGSGQVRAASKRRADALVDICRQFLDSYPGDLGGNKPHVSMIVDVSTLKNGDGKTCEFTFTGTITPETARRILCDSVVTPIICDAEGQPLWLGRSARTATPAQRRALAARDRGCSVKGCDKPPQWCDVHHLTGFTLWGGKTDIDEMALYCRRHHVHIHRLEARESSGPP